SSVVCLASPRRPPSPPPWNRQALDRNARSRIANLACRRALFKGYDRAPMISRRRFLQAVCVGLLAEPPVAEAQQVKKVHRVGLIFTTSPVSEMAGSEPVHPSARAFVQGLQALGYVEGQNLILERRSAEGRFERFGDIVVELVRLKTDVV